MTPEGEGSWRCACGVTLTRTPPGGLVVMYPPDYGEPAPEKPGWKPEIGSTWVQWDGETAPRWTLVRIEGKEAVLRPPGKAKSEARIALDSLRYGDAGWTRVE